MCPFKKSCHLQSMSLQFLWLHGGTPAPPEEPFVSAFFCIFCMAYFKQTPRCILRRQGVTRSSLSGVGFRPPPGLPMQPGWRVGDSCQATFPQVIGPQPDWVSHFCKIVAVCITVGSADASLLPHARLSPTAEWMACRCGFLMWRFVIWSKCICEMP